MWDSGSDHAPSNSSHPKNGNIMELMLAVLQLFYVGAKNGDTRVCSPQLHDSFVERRHTTLTCGTCCLSLHVHATKYKTKFSSERSVHSLFILIPPPDIHVYMRKSNMITTKSCYAYCKE